MTYAEEAAPLSAAQREATVADIIRLVEQRYVFPDRVPAMTSRLREALAAGRYDGAASAVFAQQVTEDLREASGDRHMYLSYSPAEYAAATADGGEEDEGPALAALRAREAERTNHGLSEMRILPGNVRYLRITGFRWVEDRTGFAYDDALRFLRDGDAVVIDLRGNGGGSHAAVRYLLSHFMDGGELDITFLQAGEEPMQSRTLEHLPAGRLKGKPLYVLISRQVGSAAEAFAYDVQQFHLGALVGATTSGAANNNAVVPVAPAFMLSVSQGRPVHPVSGTNWEGVGVAPDVAVDPAKALDEAQALALAGLLARTDADPAACAEWRWAQVGVAARLNPVSAPPARLRPLAGVYGGRRIVFRDGGLVWIRSNGQEAKLTPMTTDGLFAVDGYEDRFRMRLSGDALETQWIDETAPSRFARD